MAQEGGGGSFEETGDGVNVDRGARQTDEAEGALPSGTGAERAGRVRTCVEVSVLELAVIESKVRANGKFSSSKDTTIQNLPFTHQTADIK